MRHRVRSQRFNRDSNARKMLVRGLVRSYVEHGRIVTTLAKAKETRRWADKLIGKALTNTIESRRMLHAFFGERSVVNTLVEKIAPAMGKRRSGFSTITRLGKRRGDNVELVELRLVVEPKNLHTLKSGTVHAKKKPAKKSVSKKKTAAQKKKDAAVKRTAAKLVAKKPKALKEAVPLSREQKIAAQQRVTAQTQRVQRRTIRVTQKKG